jgi:hypothetical protein
VLLDVSATARKTLSAHWLDIRACVWTGEVAEIDVEDDKVKLVTPREEGFGAVVVNCK